MEKHTNDEGKVGVIVSPGHGAGWSTWSSDGEFYSMDKGLVELMLTGATADEAEAYIKRVRGEDEYQYMGGWSKAGVEWLDPGTRFTIEEYDGSESLRLIEDLTMTA